MSLANIIYHYSLLGPQVLLFCKIFLPNTPIVSSYHTNIAFYAKLFGFSMLHNPIWATHRLYHSPSKYILCPSHSTKSALGENGFELNKIIVWSRGVDRSLFTPSRRNELLRKSWINSTTTCINMPKFLSMSNLSSNNGRRKSYGILNNTPFINKDEGVAFGLSIPENKRILLYVGRISWEKNLRVLVEAFKRMNHEEYHLVVIGDGPAKVSLEAGLKHTGSVTFTGYLKGEQLAEAYASSDIFTFPSVSETFGQVVLEAQASGLPVVAMRSEGVKEIVSDGVSGILVDPTQDEERVIEEYQKAIIDISNDYKKYNSMSKHAVSISKQFTWEKAMGKCMDAYKAACHETQLS